MNSHLEGWLTQCEEEIGRLKENITLLEAGKLKIRSRSAGEDWKDVTADRIAQDKRTIEIYEGILQKQR